VPALYLGGVFMFETLFGELILFYCYQNSGAVFDDRETRWTAVKIILICAERVVGVGWCKKETS